MHHMKHKAEATAKQKQAGEVVRLRFNGKEYDAIKRAAVKDKREIQDFVKVSVLKNLEFMGVRL